MAARGSAARHAGAVRRPVQQVVSSVQQDSGVLVTGALSVSSSIGHFLAGLLLALFATLFILIDGRHIWNWIVGIFPRRARAAIDGAGRSGWATLENFVKVQILVASIDAGGHRPRRAAARRAPGDPDRDPRLPRLVHPDRRRGRHGRARRVRRPRLQRLGHRARDARRRAARAAGRGPRPAAAHHGHGREGPSARRRRRGDHRLAARRHPRRALRGPGRGGGERHDPLRRRRHVEAGRAALAAETHSPLWRTVPQRPGYGR